MFLAEKGIAVDRETLDLRRDEQRAAAFLAINPRGSVPALALDDGEVLCESAAICRYFEALHPDPPLFGATAIDVARIESWTRRIESDGYAAVVYILRNTSPAFVGRGIAGCWPTVAQLPALAERGAIMWEGFIAALDGQLEGRDWIASDGFSFADITALMTVDFAKAVKLGVPDGAANVLRWHAAASARPSAGA